MELRQLGCFLAVAEELHFGRAAARLHMLPSALGRHVRLLEDELGAPLFRRTTRQVGLTAAGAALLPDARALLERAAEAARRVRQAARAETRPLRIGAIDSAATALLPPLLYAFHQARPEVETRLWEEKSARLLPMLAAGRLDLAFTRPPQPAPGLEFLALRQEVLVVALPRGHPLARQRRIPLRALAAAPLILPSQRSRPHSFALVAHAFAAAGLPLPQGGQEAAEKQTIVNLVAAGLGLALVPDWTAQLRRPGVVYRPLAGAAGPARPEATLGAAWMPGHDCPARDAFLALLRQDFAPAPGAPAKSRRAA
jgi:DNA-binding transcriptional LysR family regulator